jgi:membrane-bound hydrogenase subunit beta
MTPEKKLTPEKIVKYFQDEFKSKIKSSRIDKRPEGSEKHESVNIWMKIDRSIFKKFVKHLCTLQFPHLAVASGSDIGDDIELNYHFSLNYGIRRGEISLNVSVEIPKSDPVIETISDLIPGAVITEREKQEMLGITVKDIPDSRRLFIPDDFPKGVYPWRRDKTGPQKMVRNLHEEKT